MEGPTYYEAAAAAAPPPEIAQGGMRADVCVVGGGLTGLSAARELAREGAAVILLEAGRVGSGASGRNGGQTIPGMRHGAVDLVARYGVDTARALIDLTLDARSAMLALGQKRHCEIAATGHVTAAASERDRNWMDAEVRCMADVLGYRHIERLQASDIPHHVGSSTYHGGILDRLGGHVNPLAYTRALADEAREAGARIYEATPVGSITTGDRCVVRTDTAEVSAATVVLACDANVDSLKIDHRPARIGRRLMPVRSYTVATAPLAEQEAAALLPGNAAVSDTRFALDYFRLSSDRRLLFSGGERYTLAPLAEIERFVRRRLVRVFPQMAATPIDYAWAGTVAVTTTRFPHVGRTGNIWHAHGYSGHGLLLAQASGRAVAKAIGNDTADYDLLAGLPSHDWPGGALLRHPLYTAGMLWFALKDRL